ncbi:MAG: hypothetical protein O7F71_16765 [Gammaproteobacteria bacterium]|nr:hypothetical protein [Gammaproteobacteria bacterium]
MLTRFLSFFGSLIFPAMLLTIPLHVTAGEALPIGQLVLQEYWVVLHASSDGPRYTIKTLDGIIVEEGLTGELLADLYPGVHDTLTHAIANPPTAASETHEAGEKTVILELEP